MLQMPQEVIVIVIIRQGPLTRFIVRGFLLPIRGGGGILGGLGLLVVVCVRHVLFPGYGSRFTAYGHNTKGSKGTGHEGELDCAGLVIVLIPAGFQPLGLLKP